MRKRNQAKWNRLIIKLCLRTSVLHPKKMKMTMIFVFLFSSSLFAASLSEYGIEFKNTKEGVKLKKELEEYFKVKKALKRDFNGSEIIYFGSRVRYIQISQKVLRDLHIVGELKMGLFKIIGDNRVSFGNNKPISFDSLKEGSKYFFNNIELVGDNGIFVKDGTYPPSAFSAAKQKVGNFEIYQNQPLFFKSNGELIPIDHIRYMGKNYYFKDMQKDGVLPIITSFANSGDYGTYARLYFKENAEYLGNKCYGCEYTLCLEKEQLYVYEISYIDPKYDPVVHGRSAKKMGLEEGSLFYADGNAQRAFVWRRDSGYYVYQGGRCSHVKDVISWKMRNGDEMRFEQF